MDNPVEERVGELLLVVKVGVEVGVVLSHVVH